MQLFGSVAVVQKQPETHTQKNGMYLNKYFCVLIKLYVWILTFDIRIILMSYYIFPTHKEA